MTKQQEITALDAFIAKLGPHSYLGPWLADNRESIVADITSDCSIDLQLPGAARHTARGIVESARIEADQLRRNASEQVANQRAQAQKYCDDQRRAVGDLIAKHAAEAVARLYGRF